MKKQLGLLFLLALTSTVACSSSEGKFGNSGVGGSTSTTVGGATGSGGTISNSLGEVPPDKGLTENGGSTGDFGFGTLPPLCVDNDPCCSVIIWITGFNTPVENGDIVQYGENVYRYDNTGNGGQSNCNKSLSNMFSGCEPGNTGWCQYCWILQDVKCAPIDITVDADAGMGVDPGLGTDAG